MGLKDRIHAFAQLGAVLHAISKKEAINQGSNLEKLDQLVCDAFFHNGWFTEEFVRLAIENIGKMLSSGSLENWLKPYEEEINKNEQSPKEIGVIMAGNIPLVGFHDMLCVLVAGHKFTGKLSSKDDKLLPAIADLLIEIESSFADNIEFTHDKLENADAIIATGSNNTSRYMEYYFGKYPHIIRKNRNSVAVLNGKETKEDLELLGHDIFTYFGLGCRNISKLYLPKGYELNRIFEGIVGFSKIMENNKYANNFDYHRSIYLMDQVPILENNLLILKEDPAISSPVATLHYEFYTDKGELINQLKQEQDQIQCVVSNENDIPACIPFGTAQKPFVLDYADGIDTIQFLNSLDN